MADPEENDKNILQKINTIIPYLNGNDPKVLISAHFGPDMLGNKKGYGPTVMRNTRYLMLLYFANLTEFFRSFGHNINGRLYFSVRGLERIAMFPGLTHKVKYDRSHALRHFLDYPEERVIHIVDDVHQKKDKSKTIRTDLFALSEKGEQFCENIMYNLIPDTENEKLDQKSISKVEVLSDISSHYELIKKTEITFLSLSEYTHRSEIEPIMKYRKFFGRQNELMKLRTHMENSNKIMIIVGDSGIGKTRLSLEFALQVQNQEDEINSWKVYFIHPYREFQPTSFNRRTLLILDDAARYQDLDKLIDFVLNPPSDTRIMLLITVMSIFRNLIINRVKEKNYEPAIMTLSKGDIVSFLQDNFSWIDKKIASQIEGQCRDSFVYAIACAEYWKEIGVSDELKKILTWRKERYIRNISEKTRCTIEDIAYVIDLISLVMPLDWIADKEYLKNILSNQKYSALENILQEASTDLYEDSLFISQEDSKVVIKPDPLADFLRLNSIENSKMQLILRQLIQHMPYRITYNIMLATRFEEEIKEDVAKLIIIIWEELNSKTGHNPEYILALYLFVVYLFGMHTLQLSYTEWKKSKVNKWLVAFEQIYDNYPEYILKLRMVATLHNTCNFCGMHGYLEQMEEAWKGLAQFCRKYPEPVFCVMLGMSLSNMIKAYAESKLFKKVEECLDELREIYESHPKDLHTVMADALLNAYIGRKNHDITIRPKMLDEYLMETRLLYQKYQEGDSAERLAAVLFNAVILSINHRGGQRLIEYLTEIRQLYEKYPDRIKKYLAIASIKYLRYLGKEIHPNMDRLEGLIDINIINEYVKPFESWFTRDLTSEEQQELWSTASHYDLTMMKFEVSDYEYAIIAVSDLKRPDRIDARSEAVVETYDFIFQDHAFLLMEISKENIPLKELHIVVCPSKIKNDNLFRAIIDKMIDQTYDPNLNEYCINDAKILLTDRNGLSTLKNTRLSLEQQYYQLDRDRSILLNISTKLPRLSAFVHLVESRQMGSQPLRSSEYCSYCKESPQYSRDQANTT